MLGKLLLLVSKELVLLSKGYNAPEASVRIPRLRFFISSIYLNLKILFSNSINNRTRAGPFLPSHAADSKKTAILHNLSSIGVVQGSLEISHFYDPCVDKRG